MYKHNKSMLIICDLTMSPKQTNISYNPGKIHKIIRLMTEKYNCKTLMLINSHNHSPRRELKSC
jgi:hypothetical protein